MTRHKLIGHLLLGVVLLSSPALSEDMENNIMDLNLGLTFQKEHNGYWYNGFTIGGTHQVLWGKRIQFGLEYLSSRFGSAHGSNALKQDKVDLLSGLHFRPSKLWDPYLGLTLGYYHIDTEGFQVYPDDQSNNRLTYGILLGSKFNVHPKWGSLDAGLGFTLKQGPGMTYPLHFKLGWSMDLFDRIYL